MVSVRDGWWLALGACLASCAPRAFVPKGVVAGPVPRRVLFIGNSYTYYRDLPQALSKLAASASPPLAIATDSFTKGGFSLERHWTNRGAIKKIRQGGWDVVVLQDQSIQPILRPENTKVYARMLHAEVERIGARTVLFMTWARRDRPEKIGRLARTYQELGKELRVPVAPVGRAWKLARKERPGLDLYTDDGSHPNQHGTYLAACVFYITLTGRDPRGLGNAGLEEVSDADARFLQHVAWRTAGGR